MFEVSKRPEGARQTAGFEQNGNIQLDKAGAAIGAESNTAILILLKETGPHSFRQT